MLETMDVEDLVKSYFRLGFSNKEILCLLAHQHGVIISKRTLQLEEKKQLFFCFVLSDMSLSHLPKQLIATY